MSAQKCAICSKTAYPLESLTLSDKTYHKLCFRCHECKTPINQKSYKLVGGNVYCHTHAPVDRSTAIDSVVNKAALNAPKKQTEGLGHVHKGTSGTAAPAIGLDSMSTKAALSAPKAVKLEGGVHKGASETAPKTAEVVNAGASASSSYTPVGAAETAPQEQQQ